MLESFARTPFEDIIQSDLFTFYVGEEKKPFLVHSKAVAATSQVFDRLINGGMSEAQTRSAEIRDVDPDTFIRFLEYAYRHDYTDPLWISTRDGSSNANETKALNVFGMRLDDQELIMPGDDLTQQATGAGATPNWGTWTNSRSAPSGFGAMTASFGAAASINTNKKTEKLKMQQKGSRVAFDKREYANPSGRAEPSINGFDRTPPSREFIPIFLAHARLYTLADTYMVHPLKEFALHRLHNALKVFQLHPERLGDIVELARYAYEHGEDRSEDGKIDAMRDLVVEYVACEMKELGKHAEFRNLMDGGGEFAGDFWDIVHDLN
ncbi:hypothetical protein SVAN01_01726 [Stagonosporopsis vannaccii]|nr:hypothetical protein SVAN01_01726 [Stagonosporopsis vannaccii]